MAQEQAPLALYSKVVLLAVATVPWVFATAFSMFEDLKWALMLVLSGLAVIAFGVDVLRGRHIDLPGGRVAAMAYTFAAYTVFTLSYAVDRVSALTSVGFWTAAAALFVASSAATARGIRFVEFGRAVAFASLGVALCGILDWVGVGVFTVVWDPIGPTGAMDSSEAAAAFYAIALPLLAANVIRDGVPWKALSIVGLVAGAAHFGAVMVPPHGYLVAGALLAVTLLVVVFQGPSRAVLLYPVVGVGGLAAMIAAGVALFAPSADTYSDANRLPLATFEPLRNSEQIAEGLPRVANFAIGRVEEVRDVSAWEYANKIGLDLWHDSPIGGHGAGGWWVMQTRFPRAEDAFVAKKFEHYPAFQSAHNGLVQALAEFGGVGILILLAWLCSVAGITVAALARREEPENWVMEHWALAAGGFSFFTVAMVTPGLTFAGSAVVFFVALGLLVREGAVLNNFKGLSTASTFGQESGVVTKLFVGVVPAAAGVCLVVVASSATVSNYHRGLADHLMLRTHFKAAGEHYKAAWDAFPGRGEVLYNQALTMRRTGKVADAADLIARAQTLRPYDARIEYFAASLAAYKQQPSDVITLSKHATSLFPNYIEAHKQLALGFDMAGRVTEAASTLEHILKLDPPDRYKPLVYSELAKYYEDALQQPKKAAEAYRNAAKFTKDNINRDQWEFNAKELDKQIERDRLIREGKQIPKELLPKEAQPHDHGLPANLQPNAPDPHHGHDH